MEPRTRWSRLLGGLGLIASATLFVACNSAGAGGSTPAPTIAVTEPTTAPSVEASMAATGSQAPVAGQEWDLSLVPQASFDPSKVSVACDEATLGTSASMTCDDITKLTIGIATTMSKNPVQQISVVKSTDDPNKIQVTFWTLSEEGSGVDAFTWVIDPSNKKFTFPALDPNAVMPTAS